MPVDALGGDAPDRNDHGHDGEHGPRDLPALSANIVRNEGEPDRVTVSPRQVSERDRTTTWLSVDADALVSLADAR